MPDDASRPRSAPSAFFLAHTTRLKTTASIGPTLDLACGHGRHAIAAAELGLSVIALDRNQDALDELLRTLQIAGSGSGRIETRQADLELAAPPTLPPASLGAILVFRYLHRPLAEWIESRLAPGGLLLYETFTTEQRALGWGPDRDDFLLAPTELPKLFPRLDVKVYEEGLSLDDPPGQTARLLAYRPNEDPLAPSA